MKKYIALLLALVLCLSMCACGSQTIEGKGCKTPEDAMLAYAEALRSGDLSKVLATYAIETYVDNYDLEERLEIVRTYVITNEQLPLAGDGYTRDLNIINRQSYIAKNLSYMYITAAPVKTDEAMIAFNGEPYDDIDELLDDLTMDDWEKILADMKVDDFLYLDDILDDDQVERTEDVMNNRCKAYGCQEIATLALEIELDGDDWYLCADVACYDGKWYILNPIGTIGTLLGASALSGGLVEN